MHNVKKHWSQVMFLQAYNEKNSSNKQYNSRNEEQKTSITHKRSSNGGSAIKCDTNIQPL